LVDWASRSIAQHVLQGERAVDAELGGLGRQGFALLLRRTDRAFQREREVLQLRAEPSGRNLGRLADAPGREIGLVQPVDVIPGQGAFASPDRVRCGIQRSVPPALVGEHELELARLERQPRGAQLGNDRIAEVDAMIAALLVRGHPVRRCGGAKTALRGLMHQRVPSCPPRPQ